MTGHKVYFIGAGPGSPDLLTLKGRDLLERCPVVFVPTPFEETMSEHLQGKKIEIPFDYRYEELLSYLEQLLKTADASGTR